MEFNHNEGEVIKEIERARSEIPGLKNHGSYQATSTGPLIRGCEICTQMKSMTMVMGYRCNASCDFCFVDSYSSEDYDENEKYNRQACFKDFCRQKDKIEGMGLTGGETLLYIPELKEYTSKIKTEKPDIYFWIYTNGLLANKENLKLLRDLGIQEIRFNLAASDYSERIMEKLSIARNLFEYVAVEVPAYPEQEKKIFNSLKRLNELGIDQLNMQELMITSSNADKLKGGGYQAGMAFLKKHFLYGSRILTYKIMKKCIECGYAFTVNDCSARKFGRIEN